MNSVNSKKTRLNGLGLPLKLFVLLLTLISFHPDHLFAEGSKDFISYSGKRLFLDTRDNQQMKVYAAAGEFINVGASHVDIQGGFIDVYRPDGTLHVRFDNSDSSNRAIIFNSTQEQNGPTGGTDGYSPGVISVDDTNAGVWTVVFDFPGETNDPYPNIENNATWTRAANQPDIQRVVLAWDITVSQGAAGDDGGSLLTGRVYSNKFVSEIYNNGNSTSPTFYILSKDGYTYKVDYNEIDPYRFTVSSNSFGIVNGNQEPVYRSVAVGDYNVSSDPSTWTADQLYLYQLMAEDYEALINNKVFFNPPATDLPTAATVTDIFAQNNPNTHTTWLQNEAVYSPTISLTDFNFVGLNNDGIECDPNTLQTGIGGYAIFNSNLSGTTTLEMDLNGDGDFDDPIDRRIFAFTEAGLDSIFWDGNDGEGNPLPIGEGFTVNYNLYVRGGEIHIPVFDVENNAGGVSFSLINENGVPEQTSFYYDHSSVGGDVSGGGTAGNALPTTTPYTYNNNFGDNKIFDFWTYIPFTGDGAGTFTININEDCICGENSTPIAQIATQQTEYCGGENVLLEASNIQENQDTLYFTYYKDGDLFANDTLVGMTTSTINLGAASDAITGEYSVVIINQRDCVSSEVSTMVSYSPQPSIDSFTVDTNDICTGENVQFTAPLSNAGTTYSFSFLSPTGQEITPQIVQQDATLIAQFNNITQSGFYTLNITNGSCTTQDSIEITVSALPSITSFFQNVPSVLCEGDSITLTGASSLPGTYELTYPNGDTEVNDLDSNNTFVKVINNISATTAGTYSVMVMNEAGCVSTETASVIVSAPVNSPQLEVEATGTGSSYCEGEDIVLSAANNIEGTGALTYTFTGPNLNETITAASTETVQYTISNFSAAAAGNYSVVVDNGCTSDTTNFAFEYVPNIVLSALIGSGTYCEGEDIELAGSSNLPDSMIVSYTWTGPNGYSYTGMSNGGGTFPATVEDITAAAAGSYSLAINMENFACENNSASLNVFVNEVPVIENVIGGGTYCQLTPVTFNATNTNTSLDSVTYTWLAPDGFSYTQTVAGNENLEYITGDLNQDWDGVWSLIVTSPQGCSADTVNIDVNIDPAIVIFNLEGEGTYCEGETLIVSANNGNPNVDTVIWSWENSNGVFASDTVIGTETFSASIENVSIQDTGRYILLLSALNACPIGVGTFDIFIEETPVIGSITGGGFVCPGEDVTLIGTNTAENTGVISYTWTGPNGFSFTGTANANGQLAATVPNVGENEVGTYTLTLQTANGCTIETPGTTEIELITTASPTISANADLICTGSSLILTANDFGDGATYTWYNIHNGNTTNLGQTVNPTFTVNPFSLQSEGQYYVEIEAPCNVSVTSEPITIGAISGVDAFDDETSTQQNTAVDLDLMLNDLMGNNSTFTYSIVTPPTNGDVTLDGTIITYTPNADFAGLDSLQYQVCSDACPDICDLAWVRIEVISQDCFIPNFFTPNEDGDNDAFFIDCLDNNYPDNNVTIYNRWGDVVYTAAPYGNDWKGQNKNDTDLPAGTYFYIIDLTPDGKNCKQGYITIIK